MQTLCSRPLWLAKRVFRKDNCMDQDERMQFHLPSALDHTLTKLFAAEVVFLHQCYHDVCSTQMLEQKLFDDHHCPFQPGAVQSCSSLQMETIKGVARLDRRLVTSPGYGCEA